jgi:hypothetical protein
VQELLDLGMHMRHKRLVIPGIVEIGEHEVLPDEQAELVAELEEIRRLVSHGAADADHVHPASAARRRNGS